MMIICGPTISCCEQYCGNICMTVLSMNNVNAQDILPQLCSVKNDTIMSENNEGEEVGEEVEGAQEGEEAGAQEEVVEVEVEVVEEEEREEAEEEEEVEEVEVEEALAEAVVAPQEEEEAQEVEVVPRTIQDILVGTCNYLQSQHKYSILSSLDHSTVASLYQKFEKLQASFPC